MDTGPNIRISKLAALRIRFILLRILILGSDSWKSESGSGSDLKLKNTFLFRIFSSDYPKTDCYKRNILFYIYIIDAWPEKIAVYFFWFYGKKYKVFVIWYFFYAFWLDFYKAGSKSESLKWKGSKRIRIRNTDRKTKYLKNLIL